MYKEIMKLTILTQNHLCQRSTAFVKFTEEDLYISSA